MAVIAMGEAAARVREPRGGYKCRRPILRETDRGEVVCRCRKCEPCQSSAKQDVVGRVIAQSMTSQHVLFVTLTYRDGEAGAQSFVKRDWDKAINRLRMKVKRAYGTSIKVLYAFERGPNNTRRCHVHAMLMFDGRHGMDVPGDPKARAWFDWWPHGHLNMVEVTGKRGELARRVRYVAKYIRKTKGGEEVAPCGWSKLDLGCAFLRGLARDHAEKGLVPKGYYFLPGLIFTGGKRKGQHQRFYLRGAGAREFAKAFRIAWEDRWRTRPTPALPWMLLADDEAIDPVLTGRARRKPVGWRRRRGESWQAHDCTAWKTVREAVRVAGRIREDRRRGVLFYPDDGGNPVPVKAERLGLPVGRPFVQEVTRFAGVLRLDREGRASFHPRDGGPSVALGRGLAGLPDGAQLVDELVAWADGIRGSGWRDPGERQAARNAVGNALLSADVRSRVGQLVECGRDGAAAVTVQDGDPLGLPEGTDPETRRRYLAAKLGKP